jgi:hypothetical protein
MATARVITPEERKAELRATFRLICEGVSKEEFAELWQGFEALGCKIAFRNPFPPEFTPAKVHELIAQVMGSAIGGYAGKKALDVAAKFLTAYLKFKFINRDKGTGRVTLLRGPKDKVVFATGTKQKTAPKKKAPKRSAKKKTD